MKSYNEYIKCPDVYAHWKGQTEEELFEQDIDPLYAIGYFHGEWEYEIATVMFLFREAFEESGAKIPAKVIKERLPHALKILKEDEKKYKRIYEIDERYMETNTISKSKGYKLSGTTMNYIQSGVGSLLIKIWYNNTIAKLRSLVEFCVEKEKETGEPLGIFTSGLGKIGLENPDDEDSWICTCGNTPMREGFYPCNEKGEEVEPTPEEWTTHCYICSKCGNIIKQKTLEITGIASEKTMKRNLDRKGT